MEKRAQTALFLQGWFLVIQTLLWGVISIAACDIDDVGLTVYAVLISVASAYSLLAKNANLLAYCFLAAATMWAGSAAALWITGHDAVAVFFAFCLAAIHSGFFIMIGCKGVKR